jgi:hypothetical protein
MSSKGRKLISLQSRVFTAVEGNPQLLDLLEIATSTARKAIFIESLLKIIPAAFPNSDKNPEELFTLFTTWFGSYAKSNTLYCGINAALKHRQQYFL